MGLRQRIGRSARVVAVLAVLWPMGCAPKHRARSLEGVPIVRVRLLQGQQLVTLNATRPPTAFPNSPHSRQLDLPKHGSVPVSLTTAGWRLGEEVIGGGVAGADRLLR